MLTLIYDGYHSWNNFLILHCVLKIMPCIFLSGASEMMNLVLILNILKSVLDEHGLASENLMESDTVHLD